MTQKQQQQNDDPGQLTREQQAAIQEGFAPVPFTPAEDVWDAYCRAHPVKQVKEKPTKFFSMLYQRRQAEIHADFYEESEGPVRVVECQEDGNYYIVPDKDRKY
jgi:hypothetical protein